MFHGRIAASPLVLTAIAGFPPEIDALAAQARPGQRFLRAAWYRGAGPQSGTTLVVRRRDAGSDGGAAIAALPLLPFGPALARANKVAGLYWPFRSILAAPDCTAQELAVTLTGKPARALGPVWRLGPAIVGDPATRLLIDAAHLAGWRVLSRPAGTGWVIDLAEAQAQGQPRKSVRRKLRAGWSKLEAMGTPQWRTIRGDQWDEGVLKDLARIEADSWIARSTDGSGAKFLTAEQRAVWQSALTDPVLAKMLSATILMLDERPVAFSFDLDDGPIRYAIAGSYAEDLKHCYIGKAINFRSMEHAVRAGLQMMDMGVGDSGFKREMGAQPRYELADLLFVHNALAARVMARVWGPALPQSNLLKDARAHG